MPGTIIFRPIEANLTLKDKDLAGKMDPYCLFHIGNQNFKSQVCKNGGSHPQWQDSISCPLPDQLSTCLVDIKDKDMLIDDKLGNFEIDIREIASLGQVRKWYPIHSMGKPAGEILVEAYVSGTGSNIGQPGLSQGYVQGTGSHLGQQGLSQGYVQGTGSNLGQQGLSQGYGQGTSLGQGGQYYQKTHLQETQFSQGGSQLGQGGQYGQGLSYGQGGQFGQGGSYGQSGQFIETSGIPVTTSKTYTQPLPQTFSQGIQPGHNYQGLNPSAGIPYQHQPHVTPPVSLSEQYAMDALSQGVDPMNTQEHFQYNAQQGVLNPGFSGIPQGVNPEFTTNVGTQSSSMHGSKTYLGETHNLPGYSQKKI